MIVSNIQNSILKVKTNISKNLPTKNIIYVIHNYEYTIHNIKSQTN